MLKRLLRILLKLYYKRNQDLLAWTIPIDEHTDINILVEKSYSEWYSYGTVLERYDTTSSTNDDCDSCEHRIEMYSRYKDVDAAERELSVFCESCKRCTC